MRGSRNSRNVCVGWNTALSLSSALFFLDIAVFSMDSNTACWNANIGRTYGMVWPKAGRESKHEVALSLRKHTAAGVTTACSWFGPGDLPLLFRRRGVDGAAAAAAGTAGVAWPTC